MPPSFRSFPFMSLFQLDPSAVASRIQARGEAARIPSFRGSVLLGAIGFTIVSVAGFAPWALFGRWFYRNVGEAGMYAACAVIFIVLSGLLLHRLLIGPSSLARFYKLFGTAFICYAVAWTVGWMVLRGHLGSVVGLLAATALMGWIFAVAFDARQYAIPIIAALFLLNCLGYFAGGVIEGALISAPELSLGGAPLSKRTQERIAMLTWGVCYGLGLGSGLGIALYLAQSKTRRLLVSGTQ